MASAGFYCLLESILLVLLLQSPGLAIYAANQSSSDVVKVEMAQGFNVFYGHYYKVAENFFSNSSFLIVQSNTKFAHIHHCQEKLKSVVAPLANYSADTFYVPVSFLELLGMLEPLQAVTSRFISSPCIAKYVADGDIQEINQTDPQQIQHFSAFLTSSSVPPQNCNYVSFDPLGEQKPLQRAEWIKYVSLFMNYEKRANDIFGKYYRLTVKGNYLCLSSAVANASDKPIVAWLSFYEGAWTFNAETFKLQYVLDAGGSNLNNSYYTNSYNMSSSSDVNSFHSILSGVDVAIDESFTDSPCDYGLQTFTKNAQISQYDSFPFMKKQSVWRYDKQDQESCVSDWLDRGSAQPHLVLADLIQALHYLQPNYTTFFLRNIARGEAVMNATSVGCTHDKPTPLEPTILPCGCEE